MKPWQKWSLVVLAVAVAVAGWVVHFHAAAVGANVPKWGWLQWAVGVVGERGEAAAPEDEDPDNTKNEIPVHTAHPTTTTLHRYVEGYGTVAARPPRPGQPAGGATLASPVAGVVAEVLCQVGQKVKAGDPVARLDDRLAKSAEDQAAAALAQAEASLAVLKAPRPEQMEIARLNVEKAKAAAAFAERTSGRLTQLAADQGATAKSVEQAAQDLSAARTDLAVSQKQLAILEASPLPEELRQEQSKVAQATAALATARVQRQLMTVLSPIDATVVAVLANPGESADPTRPLVQLVALDRLVVGVDVPAEQLPAGGGDGLAAQVFPPASAVAGQALAGAKGLAGAAEAEPVLGKVGSVSPQVDPKSGTVTVYVDLPPDAGLRPGLSVRVRIVAEEHKDVLAVPREAVTADENGDSVVALVEGTQATHKAVKAGLEENGLVEVSADGLIEASTVVTAGAAGLPAASRVKVLDP
jgi:RND family efflux transporter MFP subunit